MGPRDIKYDSNSVPNLPKLQLNSSRNRTVHIFDTYPTYTLKSESSSTWTSFSSRIPETVYTKNDATPHMEYFLGDLYMVGKIFS